MEKFDRYKDRLMINRWGNSIYGSTDSIDGEIISMERFNRWGNYIDGKIQSMGKLYRWKDSID